MKIDLEKNTVVCGDNLEWLKKVPDNSIDLCYIDPPFFSNRNYEVIWGNGYEKRSFGDRFAGGISHYIEWMRPRVQLIHQKLKPTGAMFLHCDCNASHRLRVLMDDIFDASNFRNMITWKRCDAHNDAKKQFSVISDHILFYAKTDKFKFERQYTNFPEKTLRDWYLYLELPDSTVRRMTKEERETQIIPEGARRFNADNIRSPNPRPNLVYDYKGYKPHPNGWSISLEKMKKLDKDGRLLFPKKKTGRIMFKRYLDERPGPILGDIWTDIEFVRGSSGEAMGYKTQKPVSLARRIIDCACPEDGIVLDCFAGAGTTAVAAVESNRRFLIGDVSPVAVKITAERMSFDCPNAKFNIENMPQSTDELKDLDGHLFAEKVCEVMGWKVNPKKSNDGGIDGYGPNREPVQIKNHSKSSIGRPDLQKFVGALNLSKKKKGFFVAWKFSGTAREYIANMKRDHQIEIVPLQCKEVFGALLLDEKKATEIETLYKKKRPKNWNSKSKTTAQKPVLDKAIKQKVKTSKGKLREEANQ